MESNGEKHSKTDERIRFMLLFSIMIAIVAVVGWMANWHRYRELKSENDRRETLLPAASRQALGAIGPNIVGEPIDDYPIIQVLGTQSPIAPTYYIDEWHMKRGHYTFPDSYGNEPVHWERIDPTNDLIIYFLKLGTLESLGNVDYGVGVVVQDGIIRMIIEFSGGSYHGVGAAYSLFGA